MKQNYLLLHYAYGNTFTRIRYKTSHYLKQLFDNNSIRKASPQSHNNNQRVTVDNCSKSQARIDFIDLAKGLCIQLVVLNHIIHICGYNEYPLTDTFRIFRMPLYFFLSGLFFKTYEDFKGFAKRKINKLLIPFLFFYTTTSILLPNFTALLGLNFYNKDSIGIQTLWAFIYPEKFGNGPIWFLWCLFVMNIIFYSVYLFSKKYKSFQLQILIALSISIGLVGYAFGKYNINLPAFIDSSMTALPFFVCGYVFKHYTKILYPNKYDKYNILFILACFIYIYTWL
ncbi:MAG: acyltransferase family protein [Bacteroides eggerthii]